MSLKHLGNRKFCPHCRTYKLTGVEFGPNRASHDGFQAWCRKCRSATNPKRKYNGRVDRFWKTYHDRTQKVGECIEWIGRYSENHPCITWEGKPGRMVRRLVYQFIFGELSDDERVIMACDNPRCVRQGHMKKVSREEFYGRLHNACSDATIGDRNPAHLHPENLVRGELVNTAKLTEESVRAIRTLRESEGLSHRRLAERFGVRKSTIGGILRGKTWKHVE